MEFVSDDAQGASTTPMAFVSDTACHHTASGGPIVVRIVARPFPWAAVCDVGEVADGGGGAVGMAHDGRRALAEAIEAQWEHVAGAESASAPPSALLGGADTVRLFRPSANGFPSLPLVAAAVPSMGCNGRIIAARPGRTPLAAQLLAQRTDNSSSLLDGAGFNATLWDVARVRGSYVISKGTVSVALRLWDDAILLAEKSGKYRPVGLRAKAKQPTTTTWIVETGQCTARDELVLDEEFGVVPLQEFLTQFPALNSSTWEVESHRDRAVFRSKIVARPFFIDIADCQVVIQTYPP